MQAGKLYLVSTGRIPESCNAICSGSRSSPAVLSLSSCRVDLASGQVTTTDEESRRLTAKLGPNYEPGKMEFLDPDGHRWLAKSEHVFYVPQEHVLGRPMVTFWPPTRIGFIR